MSVADDLKAQINKNDHLMYIMEADDLIAAWVYQHRNKHACSYDFTQVPSEYRYSAPLSEKSPLMKCHVSFKNDSTPAMVDFGSALDRGSTMNCHAPGNPLKRTVVSIDALEAVDFAKRNFAPYVSPILDTATLGRVVKDLGIAGKVVTKEVGNRQYVIFSGYAGIRTLFRGTRYSSRNAKVVQMAIGSLGIKNMVKSGARLTIYLTVPLTILQCILEDETTMALLVGRVTTDLVKVGIASIAGGLAGLAVGALITFAAAPIFAAIVISVGTGMILDIVDEHYGLTRKLVNMIDQYADAFEKGATELHHSIGKNLHQMEREIIYRSTGFDIENPFGRMR